MVICIYCINAKQYNGSTTSTSHADGWLSMTAQS